MQAKQAEIFSECDRLVTEKAARLNLTVGQLWVSLELAEDVDRISHGEIQPMALTAVGPGCELRFHSINATYYVRIDGEDLHCVQEIYGEQPTVIYSSDSHSISAWEAIRQAILQLEGYEVEFDTVSKTATSNSTSNPNGDRESMSDFEEVVADPVEEDEPEAAPVAAPPTPPPPPLNEADRLQRIAEEEARELHKLKSARITVLRQVEQLEERIREKEESAAKAVAAFRAVKPLPPLPPALTYDQCMAMAMQQRPGANIEDTKRLAAQLHASMSDGLARAGMGYNQPILPMEGPEVRDVADHTYNLDAPPKDAPAGQYHGHIGTVKKYTNTPNI